MHSTNSSGKTVEIKFYFDFYQVFGTRYTVIQYFKNLGRKTLSKKLQKCTETLFKCSQKFQVYLLYHYYQTYRNAFDRFFC